MRQKALLRGLVVVTLLGMLLAAGRLWLGEPARAITKGPAPPRNAVPVLIEDLATLLEFPNPVQITPLDGSARETMLDQLMGLPESQQVLAAMSRKGFWPFRHGAEAMLVDIAAVTKVAGTTGLDLIVVPLRPVSSYLPIVMKAFTAEVAAPAGERKPQEAHAAWAGDLSAYLVVVQSQQDPRQLFVQAHHTNLDPALAELPDPAIQVNGMPYFYITALRWLGPPPPDGRVVIWRYWWFDSQNHPNWYYACYRYYWDIARAWGIDLPWWYHWVYGWYYWRFWYYWSTWFPWVVGGPVPEGY